ncbi:hypothetical protein GTA51_14160 [Desulfovibrio aerotolerans]|uniref:Uncharacterized protein n=1 Tax=Solidesulfovibrio aerotolerans TaxID=295255 RepID=A0A7C9MQ70_9BACT|nr:hypothetical protein [Solidesulfovibrio aerotolerans]MYL84272.1 hypothetical protein [Solidesulfovibrio aerotolerans]
MTKLVEASAFVALCIVFYWYIFRHLRSERVAEFKEKRAALKHSFRFDVKGLIAEEMRRLRCVTSQACVLPAQTGARKLAVFRKKIQEMATYLDEEINLLVAADGERNCLEIRIDDEIYYVMIVCEEKSKRVRFFQWKKSREHRLLLRRGATTLYESSDLRLVFKMLVRSMLHDMRRKQIFKEERFVDSLACKE